MIEQSVAAVVANQKASGMPMADFWRALAMLSAQPAILRAALNRGSYTVGVPVVSPRTTPIPIL